MSECVCVCVCVCVSECDVRSFFQTKYQHDLTVVLD